MKKTLFTVICVLFVLFTKAQKSDTLKGLTADTTVFSSVQQVPEFPGGLSQFSAFLGQNIKYPATARMNHIQGRVIIQVTFEKDGSLSHLKVVHSVSDDLDKEALRAISLSPKWKPGMQNGHPVRVVYVIPISFSLSK